MSIFDRHFWKHVWTRWTAPRKVELHSGGFITIQQRTCQVCGKVEERRVDAY